MVWIIAPILKVGANQDIGETIVGLSWDADDAVLPGDTIELPESAFGMKQVLQNLIAEHKIVRAIADRDMVYTSLQEYTVGVQHLSNCKNPNLKISTDQTDVILSLTEMLHNKPFPAAHIKNLSDTGPSNKRSNCGKIPLDQESSQWIPFQVLGLFDEMTNLIKFVCPHLLSQAPLELDSSSGPCVLY